MGSKVMMNQTQNHHHWLLPLIILIIGGVVCPAAEGGPRRILVDTDLNTDDFFALLYLLKLDPSQFHLDLVGITINPNTWANGGHSINHVYDILYMMGRDDIAVGVGGEGGILDNGIVLPNVGGYLPLIEQGPTTAGGCRYRQAVPMGSGGRLDSDANYGLRKSFLPQGFRRYIPLLQPTAQQVLIEKISAGPITVFLIGAHTNFAIFLMNNPHLKKNVEHIYVMGGGVRSKNPTGCCPKNASSSCTPTMCGYPGNLYTDYKSNPYAEFNIYGDPFAAYQVIHSGIPVTLVPLDATNTIPINENFFKAFQESQATFEAQYCFQTLKMVHDIWFDDQFFTSYFMWDSFTSGIAVSMMRNSHKHDGDNEFAELEYMNITVVTSNEPYGASDGSNPFFDGRNIPKFNLKRGGVHSGHVERGHEDPFCIVEHGKGRCKDGYTAEVTGEEAVRVLVATKAKPNQDIHSPLDREFFSSFLNVLSRPENSGKFNFTTQFPYYREVFYKPDFGCRNLGKPVIFDMDMSAGDFVALFYLLKVPVEVINLKGIIATPTGWANAATIDIIYDLLHMMGRDDIPVGLGDVYGMNQSDPSSSVGDCKYAKAIPQGSGGFLDSDTLYGLARLLPRSPRRYTAENSVKHGAPRDTDHPELRQPLALDIWESALKTLDPGSKITILTNGPLTNVAKIVLTAENASSRIQEVLVVGGHLSHCDEDKGNVFTVASNDYAEFNMFLDPPAAKTVFESTLNITLIPIDVQHRVSSFPKVLAWLKHAKKTPEVVFSQSLLSLLHRLQKSHHRYQHMDTFLGEVLGAVVLSGDRLHPKFQMKPIKVIAEGDESKDGQTVIDKEGKLVKLLKNVDVRAYYDMFVERMSADEQSAVVGSFDEQRRMWSVPPGNDVTV